MVSVKLHAIKREWLYGFSYFLALELDRESILWPTALRVGEMLEVPLWKGLVVSTAGLGEKD